MMAATPHTIFRLDETTKSQLERLAEASGRTMTDVVKRLIESEYQAQESGQMDWKRAIDTLRTAAMGSYARDDAAAYVVKAAKLPPGAFDWVRENDYEGDETPASIRKEWKS